MYKWMDGIPAEEELMDPNFDAIDGLSDGEREWIRAVSPSIGSGGSAVVWDRVGYDRDGEGEEDKVKGGGGGDRDDDDDDSAWLAQELALALGSISQTQGRTAGQSATTTTQNTQSPGDLTRVAREIPETESLRRLVREGIVNPSVSFQNPLPARPLSHHYASPKKDKSKRLSLWERVTQH